jgi:lipoprotein-anchoring transpeptidase ErfK/SrfK
MRIALGQAMTQTFASNRRLSSRATGALVFGAALMLSPMFCGAASAQVLGYAAAPPSAFPSDNIMLAPNQPAVSDEGDGSGYVLPERLRRTTVALDTREAPGTIIIDTGNTALYFVLGQGRAIRYGVGVGREGFTWAGVQTITAKAEWPDWHPPAQMIARQPYLPRFMAGGPGNPLGARAMYLGTSDYRIHGTNNPATIGKFVSSGCIRLTNEDVTDLFSRVVVGTRVVVLPKNGAHLEARETGTIGAGGMAAGSINVRPAAARPQVTRVSSGRQAMNLSTSSLY